MSRVLDFLSGMAWFLIGLWAAWNSALGLVVDWPFLLLVTSSYMGIAYSHRLGLNIQLARLNAIILSIVLAAYLIFYFASFRETALSIACEAGFDFPGFIHSTARCVPVR